MSERGEKESAGGKNETSGPSLVWKRARSRKIADCRVFGVRQDWSADPRSGREHDFYVIEATDWINIIPLTSRGEVVLVEQYRHGTQELSLEIPGGMIDEGESPAEAAARELLEETGYEASEVILLGRTRPNPAIQNNWIHTFLARDVGLRGKPLHDATEQTIVRLVPLERIPALISEGAITHSLVILGFHLFELTGRGTAKGVEGV